MTASPGGPRPPILLDILFVDHTGPAGDQSTQPSASPPGPLSEKRPGTGPIDPQPPGREAVVGAPSVPNLAHSSDLAPDPDAVPDREAEEPALDHEPFRQEGELDHGKVVPGEDGSQQQDGPRTISAPV